MILVLLTSTLLLAPMQATQPLCAAPGLSVSALSDLRDAPSMAALDSRYRRSRRGWSETLIYALRRVELAPTAPADRLLLSSLPRTPERFDAFYTLTYPECGIPESLGDLASGEWLDLAYEAALRQPRHLAGFLRLGLASIHNADLGCLIPQYTELLRRECERPFWRAFHELSLEEAECVGFSDPAIYN